MSPEIWWQLQRSFFLCSLSIFGAVFPHTTPEFQARKPLDLLRDDLAIHAFTLENLLALWDKDDADAAYFLLPFVALSLATRNEELSVEMRLALLEAAFQVFYDYVQLFPNTSGKKISEKTVKGCPRKTFWTRIMCKRACNLCVGLYWSIIKWREDPSFPLALDRVSSHPVECHFGTTRSTLDGDTRWESFLNAEISAILIRRSIRHLGLRPYIRRFRTEAGCTLCLPDGGFLAEGFGSIACRIENFAFALAAGGHAIGTSGYNALITPFRNLAEILAQAGWRERAGKSSLLTGGSIMQRIFTVSRPNEEGAPDLETSELLAMLADE
jgi:hypothetical protein